MKKLIAFALAAIVTPVFADKATFPYDVNMTPRISTNETVTVDNSEVELTGTVTPETDTVAELNLSAVTFTAIDAGSWDEFVSSYAGSAAMLAVKQTEGVCAWYGYSGSGWVELTGVDVALENTYDVRISFDRTVGSKKIRYAVKANGATEYTVLKSGDDEWIAQGGSQTVLSKVMLKGTGSIASGALASGARGAYANITGVEQVYSYDYSNVVINVNVGDNVYGENLKITLTDGSTTKSIEQEIESGKVNVVDFSDEGLVPGTTYDCVIEVVKSDAPAYTNGDSSAVTLAATADWFGFNQGAFVKATGENVTITDDGKFSATDSGDPAVVTPTSESAANAKSTVEISVDYTEAFAETAQCDNAQSALALTSDGWKCLAGGDWTAITNDNVSTAAGVYATRAEFDYTANPGKVRFSVKRGEIWYVMAAVEGGATEFQLAGTSNKLNGTSFVGSGKIVAIAATYSSTDPIPPTIGEGVITLAGSTDVKLKDVAAGDYTISSTAGKKFSMKWSDADGKYAKIDGGKLKVISGTPENGIGSYDSYALGLDPTSAASKPVLDAAQNASAENVSFKVANVVPNTEVADVTMKLVETETPSADTGTEHEFTNGEATFNLPSGVRYYKVKISIKTK